MDYRAANAFGAFVRATATGVVANADCSFQVVAVQ